VEVLKKGGNGGKAERVQMEKGNSKLSERAEMKKKKNNKKWRDRVGDRISYGKCGDRYSLRGCMAKGRVYGNRDTQKDRYNTPAKSKREKHSERYMVVFIIYYVIISRAPKKRQRRKRINTCRSNPIKLLWWCRKIL